MNEEQIFEHGRVIFGDFMDGIDTDHRPYKEIADLKLMQKRIEEYLEEYNSGTKHPMRLVMFLDACDHISRIS